ncbi:uncharacterized protein LOC134214531 [Armigeres subalbatus]|uniref:uncharacterized protein LOC134214531 n=1 Tax=Armigeres subalbatus TaxID=124917 RepID=UPI002ED3803D
MTMEIEVQGGDIEMIPTDGDNIGEVENIINTPTSSAVNREVVRLSIMALFLAGFRRDPYPWMENTDHAETAEGEVGIDFHPDLYLAQTIGPTLIALLITCNVRVSNVRELLSIVHPPVCLWYALGCIMGYLRDVLPVCGFALELLHDAKVTLYYYQIMIYSSSSDRSGSIVLGAMAQCLGNALIEWMNYDMQQVWTNSKYFMDLIVAMVHYIMFYPRESWNNSLKDCFEESNRYAFREFIGVAVFGVIMLSSINSVLLQWLISGKDEPQKPFLPRLVAFDSNDYVWFTLVNVVIPVGLQTIVTWFNPGKQWIVSFTANFAALSVCLTNTHMKYSFYIMLATITMTSFTFGKALAQLVEVCPRNKIILLPAAVFVGAHMTMYLFGALLRILPKALKAQNIVLIGVCVVNGVYAVALVVANELLVTDSSRIGRRRIRRIIRTIDL